jgi:hypothetical protein
MEIGMKKILWLRENYIRYAFKRLVEERFSPNFIFIITKVLQRQDIWETYWLLTISFKKCVA